MRCAAYDALFSRPQSESRKWTLVSDLREVDVGGVRRAAVALAPVVRCPEGLFALRDPSGFVSVRSKECVSSTTRAMPVRAWILGDEVALEVPCGPYDTAERATFLAFVDGNLKFVGCEFHIEALRNARAVLAANKIVRGL
jgi:hypothetical protein